MSKLVDRDIMVDPETGFFRKGNPSGFNKYNEEERLRIKTLFLDAVRKNYTIAQSCVHAGIDKNTWYKWVKESEELSREFELAKQGLLTACNDVIHNAIVVDKNADIAMKVLKSMDDRYKVKEDKNNNMIVLADLNSLLTSIQTQGTSYIQKRNVIDYDSIINNNTDGND